MSDAPLEFRPTIDRDWLEAADRREPFAHALALWDLDRSPGHVRFVSALRDGVPVGYVLFWPGPRGTIVHWYGPSPEVDALADALPAAPCVVLAPRPARRAIEAARGSATAYPVLVLARSIGAPLPPDEGDGTVRRLTESDRPVVSSFAARQPAPAVAEYPHLDPTTELLWGAFDGDRLVGVARAAVRRPTGWILAGVFVEPAARGRHWGLRLSRAAAREAEAGGAAIGLYVREDRPAARRIYERLGFHPVLERVWLDLGSGLEP